MFKLTERKRKEERENLPGGLQHGQKYGQKQLASAVKSRTKDRYAQPWSIELALLIDLDSGSGATNAEWALWLLFLAFDRA